MSAKDRAKASAIVEVVGTLLGLAIVGAIALGMLYIRGRATLTNSIMVGVVLVIFAVVLFGRELLGSGRKG